MSLPKVIRGSLVESDARSLCGILRQHVGVHPKAAFGLRNVEHSAKTFLRARY